MELYRYDVCCDCSIVHLKALGECIYIVLVSIFGQEWFLRYSQAKLFALGSLLMTIPRR